MSKILLTCFEAFNNKSTNTTTLVVEKINQDNIYKLTLPVSYTRSVEVLKNVVRDYKPDLIISLGEANRTKNVEIEKFAHNNSRNYDITVATSDGLEQIIIRGEGCLLMSSRELEEDVANVEQKLREEHLVT